MPVDLLTLTEADIAPLAKLHRKAFPTFFLSSLGEAFLAQFYRGFLHDPSAVAVVAHELDGTICGAAVGTTQPDRFFRRLLLRRWPAFAIAGLRVTLFRPAALRRLIAAVRYRGGGTSGDGALLSSICVDSEHRGSGLGRRLLVAWSREAAERGAPAAFLTTDAEGNEAANSFYRAMGWQLSESFRTSQGRSMNRYTTILEKHQCSKS